MLVLIFFPRIPIQVNYLKIFNTKNQHIRDSGKFYSDYHIWQYLKRDHNGTGTNCELS